MESMQSLPLAEMAALLAAIFWAFTGLITQPLVHHFGATATNRYRITVSFVVLLLLSSVLGLWGSLGTDAMGILALSGFIGIFMGDTALMQGLKRLGPRRNSIIFATNAPIAAGLGFIWFGEILTRNVLIGCGLILLGVMVAIWWGQRLQNNDTHRMDKLTGKLWVGVLFALLAALGQAMGAIIAKPVLLAGADPIAASTIRVGFAAACLWILRIAPMQWGKGNQPMTWRWALRSFVSANFGLVLGMTLLVYAIGHGEVGVVMTLSVTSPILILPILWLVTGQRPNRYAWLGSALVVVGCGLIFY